MASVIVDREGMIRYFETANDFPILDVGASAGGLSAFERFFTVLPPDPGMAFVVVQHLRPPHKSMLTEILHRQTTMPIAQMTDGIEVKPNDVYVIPPDSNLALRDGHLMLLKPRPRVAIACLSTSSSAYWRW